MARQKAPENETPQQKFIRVANVRIRNFDKAVHGIESLSSGSSGEYSKSMLAKLEAHLTEGVQRAINALRNPGQTVEVNALFSADDIAES